MYSPQLDTPSIVWPESELSDDIIPHAWSEDALVEFYLFNQPCREPWTLAVEEHDKGSDGAKFLDSFFEFEAVLMVSTLSVTGPRSVNDDNARVCRVSQVVPHHVGCLGRL